MHDVGSFEQIGEDYLIDTGSPHYIKYVKDLDQKDMIKEGQSIRYSDRFKEEGINVNLIQENEQGLSIRTYERGVEGETHSCGTGCTAAALAYSLENQVENVLLKTREVIWRSHLKEMVKALKTFI